MFPDPDTIREPTLADVFGICCGPRLMQKALRLHGEDLAKKPEEEEKKADR